MLAMKNFMIIKLVYALIVIIHGFIHKIILFYIFLCQVKNVLMNRNMIAQNAIL